MLTKHHSKARQGPVDELLRGQPALQAVLALNLPRQQWCWGTHSLRYVHVVWCSNGIPTICHHYCCVWYHGLGEWGSPARILHCRQDTCRLNLTSGATPA